MSIFKEDPKSARLRKQVLHEIHQAALKEKLKALLRDGLSRKTIEAAIKEHAHERASFPQ